MRIIVSITPAALYCIEEHICIEVHLCIVTAQIFSCCEEEHINENQSH